MEKLFQKFMDMINDFIRTVGLDKSFFFQLALAVALYFLSKKLFLQDYLENFKKSEQLTKGRMSHSKGLEEQIEKQKALYEEKAKKLHAEFQKTFDEMKKTAQKEYQQASINVHKEQKDLINTQRLSLKQSLTEQDVQLQKELPILSELLVEKLKS